MSSFASSTLFLSILFTLFAFTTPGRALPHGCFGPDKAPAAMLIDPNSIDEWNRKKAEVLAESGRLEKVVEDLAEKLARKNWNNARLRLELLDSTARLHSLHGTLHNLEILEVSSQVYELSDITHKDTSSGYTAYDTGTGHIVFHIGSTGNFVHETTHGGQFENGQLAYDTAKGLALGDSITDRPTGEGNSAHSC